MKFSWFCLFVFAASVFCLPVFATDFPVKIEETVLDNGLKVFAVKRPGVPQAACALGVRVGSVAERPGYTGTAHFLEHMMFKGTDKIGVKDAAKDAEIRARIDTVMAEILRLEDGGGPEDRLEELRKTRDRLFKEQQENLEINHIFRIYSEAGGAMTNAGTSGDFTVYFSLLPPARIELFFWVEAERFGNPVFRQFHSEKDVVREERRLSENRPGHAFHEEFNRVLFGSHPYSHPVLGYHEEVRRLTRHDLRRFFNTHYTPDNMFLMVAGDVKPAEVFRLARKYFGSMLRSREERPRVPTLAITKSGASRVYGHGAGNPSLTVAYRMPPGGKPAEVECEMLAMHLGDPEGSLRERLVRELGVATSVGASYDGRKYAGVFWINVEMKPDRAPEEAEEEVLKAVRRLVDAPLSEKRVKALARRFRARILGSFKDEMRTGFLFLRREILGSWKDIEVMLERAGTMTPEMMQEVASEYFVRNNRVVGILEKEERPAVSAPPAVPAEPKTPPRKPKSIPASWKDLKFKQISLELPRGKDFVSTLSNGIRVVAVSDPADPVFRIEAMLMGGSSEDPEGKEGLCGLLAAVADRSGLPGITRKAIREKLEDLVGEAGVGAGFDVLVFSLNTFKEDREKGLKLFKALLLYTVLEEEVFKAEKEKAKSLLLDMDARPRSVSNRAFRELLWGKIRRTRRATASSLDAIAIEDIEKALARHRDPRRCILTVSGDFEKEKMIARLEELFGDWEPSGAPLPDLSPGAPLPPCGGLHVMDFPASQGYVMIGSRSLPKSDDAFPTLRVLSLILSRRLFNRIRSNEGLAYQAGARLQDDWQLPSLFTVIFQTKARSVPFGIWLALDELKKIAREGPTEKELERAKRQVGTRLQVTFGRAGGKAEAFGKLLLLPHVDIDWYRKYWSFAQVATAGDVRKAARKYLKPENLLILCVGKRAPMDKGDGEHPHRLSDFGPVTVMEPPRTQAEPKTPRDVVLFLIRRIAAGDVEGMKPYLAKAYRKRLEEPGMAAQIKMQGRMLGQAKYEVLGAEEEGDEATVTVKFEVKMGEQTMGITMVFQMKRVGDRWVCAEFRPVR